MAPALCSGKIAAMAEANRDDDVLRLLTAGRDREAALRGAALAPTETTHHHDGGSMQPLAQFEQLGPLLGTVIAGLRPDQLDEPTPCAEFTVRGVLEHMIGGATAFAAAYRGEAPRQPDLADPIASVQAALGDLSASISAPGALDRTIRAPFGELDGATFARFIVLDGLVHGWDLATATGHRYAPPNQLVAAVSEFAHQALDPLRDGQTFKAAVEPTAHATPMERLAAYTGRAIPEAVH
jgi:uncharacterized protein (TIGR03086 family)